MFEWLTIFRSPTVIAVFILELAERTAYYGTIFSISEFATLMLKIPAGAAFVITNTVFALAPLSAFFAGILADTWFHRTEVLIAAASVYVLAIGLIALSATPGFFGDDEDFAHPSVAPFLLFFPGLVLLSVGYGAFKVCTSPLVAEGVLCLAKKEVTFVVSGLEGVSQSSHDPDRKQQTRDDNNSIRHYETDGKRNAEISDSEQQGTTTTKKSQAKTIKFSPKAEEGDSSVVAGDDDNNNNDNNNKNNSSDDSDDCGDDEIYTDTDDSPVSLDQGQDTTVSQVAFVLGSSDDRGDDEKSRRSTRSVSPSPTLNVDEKPEKVTLDKDSLLALTYSVYVAVINLGSLIGFSVIPSLRNLGGVEYYTGTLAEDGKKKSTGYIYAWGACFGFAALALVIFILLAKFSRRFVRPKGFHHAPPSITPTKGRTSLTPTDSSDCVYDQTSSETKESRKRNALRALSNRTPMKTNSTSQASLPPHRQKQQHQPEHPMQYVANLGEALGLSCLVNCCCPSFSSDALVTPIATTDYHNHATNGSSTSVKEEKKDHLDDSLLLDHHTRDNKNTAIRTSLNKGNKKSKRHVRSLTNVLKIFFMLPIYWFATALTSSSFQIQAFCAVLPPWLSVDMLNTANTVAFLVFLPIVQVCTSKLLERLHVNGSLCFGLFKSVLVLRLLLGFLVAALAMLYAGFLQVEIDKVAVLTEDGDCILKNQEAVAKNVLPGAAKMSLPFILAGIASAITDPAALEAAFELAPADMRSTVMSLYLLESSLSGFVGLGLTPFFSDPSRYAASFFSMSVVLAVLSLIWAVLIRDVHKQTAPAAVVAVAAKKLAADEANARCCEKGTTTATATVVPSSDSNEEKKKRAGQEKREKLENQLDDPKRSLLAEA